ncbi:MAG: isochorismatase family protein [Bacteroidota bacterium]|nr:isochorismatase family protein [Bacteroidota bacterium]
MIKNKENTLLSETNSYLSGTYTDQYQLAMSQAYFLNGMHNEEAVFDYFFRKLPFDGGYAVFAGLETLLEALENLTFTPQDMEFLSRQDFDDDFLSGFFDNGHKKDTGLAGYLKSRGVDELYVCGLAADVCVYFTLRDAVEAGFNVTLILDGTKALDNDNFLKQQAELKEKGVKFKNSTYLF